MSLPTAVEALIAEFAKLPGVGRRTAERMALGLVLGPPERLDALSNALISAHQDIGVCPNCGYFAQDGECLVCRPERDGSLLMVVERAVDVVAMEKAGGFRGLYHVLGGHLSPLKGIGPKELRMDQLLERAADPVVKELILATSPSVEGDATALFIARHVERDELAVTRLGRGVPMGGSLEFADAGTLRLAMESRRGLGH
jgi:recombination protein RecR